MDLLKSLQSLLRPQPELLREVYIAHFHRLPDNIQVAWEREGEYIVGTIKAGDKEFMTQGKGPEDFVEMVHDAVYTAFDIPGPYRPGMKAYDPPQEFKQALGNKRIRESSVALAKS